MSITTRLKSLKSAFESFPEARKYAQSEYGITGRGWRGLAEKLHDSQVDFLAWKVENDREMAAFRSTCAAARENLAALKADLAIGTALATVFTAAAVEADSEPAIALSAPVIEVEARAVETPIDVAPRLIWLAALHRSCALVGDAIASPCWAAWNAGAHYRQWAERVGFQIGLA